MCSTILNRFIRCLPVGVALLALTVILPTASAQAQCLHGVGTNKNCLGPRGDAFVLRGETITNTISVANFDTCGDAIRVDSIIDVVHHSAGDVTSPNLLASPVTLPALGNSTQVSFSDTVQQTDMFGALTD